MDKEKLLAHIGKSDLTGSEKIFLETLVEDAEPVKHGKWTYDNSYVLHCSYCGREAYYSEWGAEKFPYCPYCGAEMKE